MPYRTSRMRLRSEVQLKTALGPWARPSRQALVLLSHRTKSPDWEVGNGGVIERGTPSRLLRQFGALSCKSVPYLLFGRESVPECIRSL